jgi:WD40 repeat protein
MDSTVRLWDVESGTCHHVFTGHSDEVHKVEYSAQGDLVASASYDNTTRLWDVESGACRHVLVGHSDEITNIVHSPKGGQLASSSYDETLQLWDVGTGACNHILIGHSHWVNKVAYSPQGDLVASASNDNTVRLWDVGSGQCRATIREFQDNVHQVVWTATSEADYLIAGCSGGSVRIWQVKDVGGLCHLRLHWKTTKGELSVTDASIRNVHGLDQLNTRILTQGGAVEGLGEVSSSAVLC